MATIETRRQADGTVAYRARVRLQGHPARTQTFARKTDARDWARQLEADLKRGKHLPSSEAARRTVTEMIDRFVTQDLPRKKHNRDAKKTAALLEWWKASKIGKLAITNVTPAQITECRDELLDGKTRRGGPRSPATVNRYLAALSKCMSVAMRKWHWIEQTPMPAVERGEESRGVVRFLDTDERDRLLAACSAHSARWLYPLVLLALSTGARRGELLGLKWSAVDLTRGALTFYETKNGETRTVPVRGKALDALRERAKVRPIDSEQPVFTEPVRRVEDTWREALSAADVKDFRFHDLRHTAASYLAMSGATTAEIAAVLGHKTLAMVKRYSHLSDQHTGTVLDRMTTKFLA